MCSTTRFLPLRLTYLARLVYVTTPQVSPVLVNLAANTRIFKIIVSCLHCGWGRGSLVRELLLESGGSVSLDWRTEGKRIVEAAA